MRVPRGPGWGKSVVVGFGISQLPCAEKNVTHGEHRVLRVRVPKLLEAYAWEGAWQGIPRALTEAPSSGG